MSLPRLHLFEWEDQPWFPALLRNYMTDYLRFVETKFELHRHAVPTLERALEESGAERIVDLCSGAGGPLVPILEQCAADGKDVPAILTDPYPYPAADAGPAE